MINQPGNKRSRTAIGNRLYHFVVLAVVLACMAVYGCARKEAITSWNTARFLEIQNEWESVARTRVQGKNDWERIQNNLDRILEANLDHDDLLNLAATCEAVAINEKDRSEFENAVLAHIERSLIDSGDRDNLVNLLSRRCRLTVRLHEDIELYLALRGSKLNAPIMVLGEAYSRCQVPEVRHSLAGAVRRAFIGHGITGNDDAEYVTNAMQWYETEKGRLIVNGMYLGNAVHYPAAAFDNIPHLYERLEQSHAESAPAAIELQAEWHQRNAGKWVLLFEKRVTQQRRRMTVRCKNEIVSSMALKLPGWRAC